VIRIYDSGYRGDCRLERYEQIDCASWLKYNYPERWPLILHIPNEASGRGSSHLQTRIKEGVKTGASDILDLNWLPGIFELKRMDRTKSKVSKEQREFLQAGSDAGHFAAIVYGFEQFKLAYADYLAFIASKQLT